ncbi:MAG: hypothetical protein ACTHJ9_17310 [Rhodanobacter sp.]
MGLSAGQNVSLAFNGGIPDQQSLVNNLNTVNPLANEQYNTNGATSAATATAASMAGSNDCTLNMTGTLAGAANLTTATAAALIAQAGNAPVGSSWRVRIMNTSSGNFAWTLVGGTGVTVNGTATIAQDAWRDFQVAVGANSTITMQAIGGGTT